MLGSTMNVGKLKYLARGLRLKVSCAILCESQWRWKNSRPKQKLSFGTYPNRIEPGTACRVDGGGVSSLQTRRSVSGECFSSVDPSQSSSIDYGVSRSGCRTFSRGDETRKEPNALDHPTTTRKTVSENKPQSSVTSGSSKGSKDDEEASGSSKGFEALLELFARKLGFGKEDDDEPHEKLLDEPTFEGIVKYMKSGKCKNVIVLSGAGISTSAGIPDFRSPGSGLYDNLQKYNLPHPQAIFEISFFLECPQPFFALAKELYPGCFKPTIGHYFIRLLHEKGMLLRTYTQNIDTLERIAGIPEEKIVEAHGTFFTSHCLNEGCRKEYTLEWMKEKIFADEIPTCTECRTVVKPDIVFFGETLPDKFYDLLPTDFPDCDLLIVMGTSLVVQPFASLVDRVPASTPRLLINKEKAGKNDYMASLFGFDGGMKFDSDDNYRDVAWIGSCDEGCQALAEAIGWGEELDELVKTEHSRIDKETEEQNKKK